MIVGVNHVQVNVSRAQLVEAHGFYGDFLGLTEIRRPEVFSSPGYWFNAGSFEIHLGVEEGVDRAATRAHVAYEVDDIGAWREKVVAAGYPFREQPMIEGFDRFHFRDPFGNNIELIQRLK